MATVRIKKMTSYRTCSCSSNTVVVRAVAVGAWWAIGRVHEQSFRFGLTIDLEKKAPD